MLIKNTVVFPNGSLEMSVNLQACDNYSNLDSTRGRPHWIDQKDVSKWMLQFAFAEDLCHFVRWVTLSWLCCCVGAWVQSLRHVWRTLYIPSWRIKDCQLHVVVTSMTLPLNSPLENTSHCLHLNTPNPFPCFPVALSVDPVAEPPVTTHHHHDAEIPQRWRSRFWKETWGPSGWTHLTKKAKKN